MDTIRDEECARVGTDRACVYMYREGKGGHLCLEQEFLVLEERLALLAKFPEDAIKARAHLQVVFGGVEVLEAGHTLLDGEARPLPVRVLELYVPKKK